MEQGFRKVTRITAIIAVLLAFIMLATPVLQLGGKTVNISPVDNVNVAAANGNRVLTIGQVDYGGGMATLNPFLYTQSEEFQTIWPCYSTMLAYDLNDKVIGDLANSWSVAPDGVTWTFKLANNAYFVDPTAPTVKDPARLVTWKDVAWTYWEINNRTANHLSSYFNDGYAGIIKSIARGANDFEVIITTTKPYAPFQSALTVIPIVPEYIWGHLPGSGNPMSFDNLPMVGSGPFYSTMTSVPSTVGTLLRNTIWFQEVNRGWQLHVDTVQYKTELSQVTAWSELTTNPPIIDIQLMVAPSQYKNNIVNTTTPWVKGFAQTTGFVFEYQLNQLNPELRAQLVKAGTLQNGGSNNPLINDPTVMLALQMSVNRQEFIDQAYLGFGSPTDSIIPKVNRWYNPEPNPLTFNPSGARQILMDAGWAYDSLGNPATSLTVPLYKKNLVTNVVYDGLSFKLISLLPESYWDIGSRKIVDWAAQAGVQYNRQLLSTNQANGAWYKGDYDAWLWDWFFSPTSDPSTDCLSVHTTGAIGSWSGSYFHNTTFNDLYNQSLVAVDDGARRIITDEMQHILYQSHMVSYPADRKELYAVNYRTWDKDSYGNWEKNYQLMPDWAMPYLYMRLSPTDNLAPNVTISSLNPSGFVNNPINFVGSATDGSVGGMVYQWYWGDGASTGWVTNPSQSHPYLNDGVYTVYFAAKEQSTPDGFISWKDTKVTVVNPANQPPSNALIVMTPTTGINSGTQVSFTGSATDTDSLYYTWSFGDGTGAVGSAPTHQFKTPGTYTVLLNVTDNHPGSGRPAQDTQVVSVAANRAPTVTLPSSALVQQHNPNTYTATAADLDGDALRFTWLWGDGAKSVTTIPSATHTYSQKKASPGYDLVVWADDLTTLPLHNASAHEAVTVVGNPTPPTITAFTVNGGTTTVSALTGQLLNFTGSAKDTAGDAMTFQFKFGDGVWYNNSNPGTGNNVIVTNYIMHPFLTAGTFNAYLYVYDGQDTTPSTVRTIIVTVNDPPMVTPQTTKTGTMGVSMSFSGAAFEPDGDPMRFSWNFGDGTPVVVGQNPTHTYAKWGQYTFTLYVDDLTGIPGHNVTSIATAKLGFVLSLSIGWNLISLPFTSTYTANTLGLNFGEEVVNWNATSQTYDKIFIKGVSPLSMNFALADHTGYWVYATSARTLVLQGTVPTVMQYRPVDVPATGGWVLIGFCSKNTTRLAEDLRTQSMYEGGTISTVVKWNAATGLYTTHIMGLPLNNFVLTPGLGFWIYVNADGMFQYNP